MRIKNLIDEIGRNPMRREEDLEACSIGPFRLKLVGLICKCSIPKLFPSTNFSRQGQITNEFEFSFSG